LDSPKRIEKSREILAQKAKETPAKAIEKVIPTPAPKIVAFQDFEKEETSVKKEERISPSKPTPTKVFTDRTGARIVFLIDISSSMNKPFKMDLLKETVKNLIDVLKPQDQIALITFNYETKVIWPLSNLEDKDAVKLTIDDIQTIGGTKGSVGIEKAYEAIKENLGENSLIVLATDGLLTNNKEEEENIYKIIDTHYTQNILFNVLGFGISQHIHFKMNKLAMLGGGFFMPFVASKKNQEKQFIDNILNKLNRK
jgi:Mg-chelatase subunit ChlD